MNIDAARPCPAESMARYDAFVVACRNKQPPVITVDHLGGAPLEDSFFATLQNPNEEVYLDVGFNLN